MKTITTNSKKLILLLIIITLSIEAFTASTLNLKLYIQGYWNVPTQTMRPVLTNQNLTAPLGICDTILVEIHDQNTFETFTWTKAILLQDGTAICTFPVDIVGSYYIAVVHRNAIATWSTNPQPFTAGGTTFYNFSLAASKAFGDNQFQLPNGAWALYSGDIEKDGAESIDLLDLSIAETLLSVYYSGYNATDINGDGNTDLIDFATINDNLSNFVFSNHP